VTGAGWSGDVVTGDGAGTSGDSSRSRDFVLSGGVAVASVFGLFNAGVSCNAVGVLAAEGALTVGGVFDGTGNAGE
jgi:hypothetical protein